MQSVGSSSSLSESVTNSSAETKTKRQKPRWQASVSKDWLEEVGRTKQSFTILNGLQFCRTWTLSDSLRDLIQNATDSMYAVHKKQHRCKRPRVVLESPPNSWDKNQNIVAKIFLECEKGGRTGPAGYLLWTLPGQTYKGPIVTIINLGAGFSSEALTVGLSTKGEDDAGGHGEGLKAAITAAMRVKNSVEILQSGVAIKFKEGNRTVSYRVVSPINKILEFKRFTKELTKTFGVTPQNDVIVHVGNNPDLQFETYLEAIQRFLFLTHRHPLSLETGLPVVNRKETKSGRALLLGEEFAGKVYAVGIYYLTQEEFQKSYGVDFIKSDALSRDRNTLSNKAYLLAMGELISELLEDDPQFAHVILDEFQRAEKDPHLVYHLDKLPQCASAEAKESLIRAYKMRAGNEEIKYIVSGTSSEHLTDNAIVPKWCDVQACRVVSPVLFSLISEGYPSSDEIRRDTSMKLEACPCLDEQQRVLCEWLFSKAEFFSDDLGDLISRVEVRESRNMLDVPLYIVKEGRIIFSERGFNLKVRDPRKFLDLAYEALQELKKEVRVVRVEPIMPQFLDFGRELLHIEPDLLPEDEDEPILEEPIPIVPFDFPTDFVVPVVDVGEIDDSNSVVMLRQSLTKSVSFGPYSILCTPLAYNEWNRLTFENQRNVEVLTIRCINACIDSLQKLTSAKCPLSFFVSEDRTKGFASEEVGIHINLRSVLLECARGNQVEEHVLKAYFDVLIAHEYAHYVKSEDNHNPSHAHRTEANLQKILQEAYRK